MKNRDTVRRLPVRRWARLLAAALTVLAGAATMYEARHLDGLGLSRSQRRRAVELAKECPGWLVFQRESVRCPEGIYVTRVGSRIAVRIADGRYPRWSPDGRWIAFFAGSNVCLINSHGRERRVVATTEDPQPRALAFHPSGCEIWFTDGDRLRAVRLQDGNIRTAMSNIAVRGLGFSADGARMIISVTGHRMFALTVSNGVVIQPGRSLGRGCSATIAPDGTVYSDLDGRHVCVRLRRWDDDSVVAVLDGPEGWPVDNESWSNHRRWMVVRTERPGPMDIWVWDLESRRAVRVTGTGDANRPHLWVPDPATQGSGEWFDWWRARWFGGT